MVLDRLLNPVAPWTGKGMDLFQPRLPRPSAGFVMHLLPSPSLPHYHALSHPKKLFSSDGAYEIASVVAIRSQAINNEPF